jgi:hypothetical protein
MGRLIPDPWMPECRMARVITHWTAGGYHASETDREHYHLLIEGDGRLVRGDHSIRDNLSTADGAYAAHTRALNTGSIGVTVCCMSGAIQEPFRPGEFPMRREQYEAMALAVADLCRGYEIPVTAQTVLGHGEVERLLGVAQRGKWDPMRLPWSPGLSVRAVGDAFRETVRALLRSGEPDGPLPPDSSLPPVTILLNGRPVSDAGFLLEGTTWAPLRPLANALGWRILAIDDERAWLATPIGQRVVPARIRGDRGYAPIRDLCAAGELPPPSFDPVARTVSLVALGQP